MKTKMFLAILIMLFAYSLVSAAYTSPGWIYGFELGAARGDNAGSKENIGPLGRGYVQLEVVPFFYVRVGGGYTQLHASKTYSTQTLMADARLIFQPFRQAKYSPFIYIGQGASKELKDPNADLIPLMPLGVGFHTRIKPGMKLEVTTGYNLSNSDMLDGINRNDDEMNSYTDKKQDGFFSLTVGLSFSNERQEPAPKVVETVPYVKPIPVTPPAPVPVPVVIPEPTPVPVVDLSKLDSDNDGLSDADEIDKYKTDPQNPDTDGDGLKDGAEVTKHKTDPLNPDTDGDGLKDGAEVTTHDTDPLNPDTDGDGLKDGAEVLTYKTNPLVKDTDKGTVDDGKEVAAGTNPLDPSDDVFKLEEGKTFTLDGIVFETGKATILPASEKILEQAYGVLAANPNLNILITGHTDSVGSASSNLSLSQRRADAVMNWLIKRGIDAKRLKAEGKGLTTPKATNSTPEGRQINRRIDFEVVH